MARKIKSYRRKHLKRRKHKSAKIRKKQLPNPTIPNEALVALREALNQRMEQDE
jgi:hypothetical protein